jgi:hypothetical protein
MVIVDICNSSSDVITATTDTNNILRLTGNFILGGQQSIVISTIAFKLALTGQFSLVTFFAVSIKRLAPNVKRSPSAQLEITASIISLTIIFFIIHFFQ